MKFLGHNVVLCLSPHPDDIEYSMSGTIAKYTDTKFIIYCLTLGTSTDETSGNDRLEEVKSFWNELDVSNVHLVKPNVNTFESLTLAEWTTLLDKKISFYKPNAILTTSDIDSHQEHKFVSNLVPSLIRNKPISVIEYKSPSTLHNWTPNYLVSIENFCILKYNTLHKSFPSQTDALYFNKECINAFHTDYQTMKRGIGYVEQFKIKLMYGI
jgi:LmbE family N-acetylglucosaminyl deacetylase